MLGSSRIAFIGATAFALTLASVEVVTLLMKARAVGSPPALGILMETAVGVVFVSLLVWIGTYVGARLSKPEQRTGRLAMWLVALYAMIGILLSLPIKTHAITLDLPAPGSAATTTDWGPLLMALAPLLGFVIVPVIATRILAAVLGALK